MALLPVAGGTLLRAAGAADMPHVDTNDPTAKALQYTEDAASVDAAKRGGADRHCGNCRFYTGAAGDEYGPCSIFPGKSVHAQGWCTAWATRPA